MRQFIKGAACVLGLHFGSTAFAIWRSWPMGHDEVVSYLTGNLFLSATAVMLVCYWLGFRFGRDSAE